jgi:hypothetical protein
MDKAKLYQLLILLILTIFVIISLIFGFIESSFHILTSRGFHADTLYFLLIIPFIVLLISFFKVIIGLGISNSFIVILIVLSSFLTGPFFTLVMLLLSIFAGYFAKTLISGSRLHFAVKLSMILSFLSIGLLLVLPYIDQLARYAPGNGHFAIAYSMLVIALVNDRYFSFKLNGPQLRSNLLNLLSTLLFSFFCYFLLGGSFYVGNQMIVFPTLQELIYAYPDLVFFSFFLQILIGRYTGLRLTEALRFRKILFKGR